MSYPKWYTHRGKWTLTRLIKDAITSNNGELPLEDLLGYLREQGYLKDAVLGNLHALGVEVIDGRARLR